MEVHSEKTRELVFSSTNYFAHIEKDQRQLTISDDQGKSIMSSDSFLNRIFKISLRRNEIVQATLPIKNCLSDRILSIFAETDFPDICEISSPRESDPEHLSPGDSKSISLIFKCDFDSEFIAPIDVLIKDKFSGRLIERLRFLCHVNCHLNPKP